MRLLNARYVPVFTSNEDFRGAGSASPADRAALERIRREALAAKMSVGTVHVFLCDPDGRPTATLHVADAQPARLLALLEREAARVPDGRPAAPPRPPLPPPTPDGGLRLHVVSRYLERRGGTLVPVTGAGGNWSALPGEDWVLLDATAAIDIGPPSAHGEIGQRWDLPDDTVRALLRRVYPPTENNDLRSGRIERATLSAVVDRSGRGCRAILSGRLTMTHPFYTGHDARPVDATLSGYATFGADRRPREFRLATVAARYGDLPFGAAIRET